VTAVKTAIKPYYTLTKPGIIYGNILTAAAGFLLASKGHISFWLLIATLGGMSAVIASACVFNNYIDRDIDQRMDRTKKRALVSGVISGQNALIYATLLGVIGFVVLTLFVNSLVVSIGLIAFVDYIILYGIAKRRSVHGTLVGAIAGAAPIVAGYCAVTDHFNGAALLLFLILACWQMPHFYAIAMYRFNDYKAADLPILPVKRGLKITKIQIVLYVIAFGVATTLLTIFGYTGYVYLVIMLLLSLAWLRLGLKGLHKGNDDKLWARKMFFFSLIIILSLSVMLSFNFLLP
jgi:protoheme IX farnesyltransferase